MCIGKRGREIKREREREKEREGKRERERETPCKFPECTNPV